MRRNLEIAVVDANRGFGNGFCLPAGPLREQVSRLKHVDIVVNNDAATKSTNDCSYTLQIVGLKNLHSGESRPISSFTDKQVHAVAGIGHPERFFTQLRQNGLDIIAHAFPDHHAYQQNDFSGWDEDCIIMTEKDAVKCRPLALKDAWVLTVKAEMSNTLESRLHSKLLPLLDHTVSR